MLLKIYTNIINNPTKTQKYGDLSIKKIGKKLSKCDPALKLLLLVGFEMSENKTRLIWQNTENNLGVLTLVRDTLSSMVDTSPNTSASAYNQTPTITNNIHQPAAMTSNLNMPYATVYHLLLLFVTNSFA